MWNEILSVLLQNSCRAETHSSLDMRSSVAHQTCSCYAQALAVSRWNRRPRALMLMPRAPEVG